MRECLYFRGLIFGTLGYFLNFELHEKYCFQVPGVQNLWHFKNDLNLPLLGELLTEEAPKAISLAATKYVYYDSNPKFLF